MKKYLVLIVGVALFACTQKQSGFNINVKLKGAEGKILLEKRGGSTWIPVDTADIVNGVAVLEGEVPYPGNYYLSVIGERQKAIIFVENAKMGLVGNADSIQSVVVTGSQTHNEFAVLNLKLAEITGKYKGLYQESRSALAEGDTTKSRELMNQLSELYKSTISVRKDFIKNNPSSYINPYLLSDDEIQYETEEKELDAMVSALDPKLDSIPFIKYLKEHVVKVRKVAVGQIAPDFNQNNPDGKEIKFSEVYSQNELTLLDFWASWCSPCRAENPNVVAVYNEYKTKGFTVFGVSLDREKDQWLKAIADDKLAWTQVSDLAYWQNEAAKMYAIQSIPSSLLVDKTGKIVAKNKRGIDLRTFVSETLK